MKNAFDNSALIPPYSGMDPVDIHNVAAYAQKTDGGYRFTPPPWVKDLIFMQGNICKITSEGTFASALPVLEHLQKTGVNALWITPFFENIGNANRTSHYGNQGPHTLASDSFRATEYADRVKELQKFVREAHKRGIYVFADVVTYGVLATSPIYEAYLQGKLYDGMDVSEWFTGAPLYSGYQFRWESPTLRAWFTDRMTDLIRLYDLDGFRVDSEPTYLFYDSDGDGTPDTYADVFTEVRLRIAGYTQDGDGSYFYPPDGVGRRISVFSEKNNLRNYGYDFEQLGVIHYGEEHTLGFQLCNGKHPNGSHHNWFLESDLATSVKEGRLADGRWFTHYLKVPEGTPNTFQYYTYCISNHDYHSTAMNRRLWVAGYQALLAPFIPVWYYGEESGLISTENIWLNAVPVDTEKLLQDPLNRDFYEQFCKLIALRRRSPDLFGITAEDIRDSNVADVQVSEGALAYLRYTEDRAALVLANPTEQDLICHATIPQDHLPHDASDQFWEVLTERTYGSTSAQGATQLRNIPIPAYGMAVLITRPSHSD